MRKPLNKGGKGDEFLPLETLEDFANLDALTPQPVRSASVIPFVLAGFVLSNRAIGRVTGAIFLVAYLAFVWLVF